MIRVMLYEAWAGDRQCRRAVLRNGVFHVAPVIHSPPNRDQSSLRCNNSVAHMSATGSRTAFCPIGAMSVIPPIASRTATAEMSRCDRIPSDVGFRADRVRRVQCASCYKIAQHQSSVHSGKFRGAELKAMIRRYLPWRFALPIFILSTPAMADCNTSLSEARAVAREISVDITAGETVSAGVPFKITWSNRSAAKSELPLYIVLITPPEVRFAGKGFMALAAGAAGPYQMQYEKAQTRALFATHRKIDIAESGELAVTPYRSGVETFGWAVVAVGTCGERILEQYIRKVEVTPGSAELVVQDRFDSDQPKERIRSNDGKYDLLIFERRFEVQDAATGAVLFKAAGIDPNFSPTARFVAWRSQPDGHFSIADLVSGNVIASDMEGTVLAWARNDSYIVAGGDVWGAVQIKNSLVDHDLLLHEITPPHPRTGWERDVTFDFDRGFVRVGTGDVADLFLSVEPNDVTAPLPDERTFSESDYDDGLRKKTYLKGWNLGERLKLSHIAPDRPYFDKQRREQSAFLVRHSIVPATPTNSPSGAKLFGRAINVGTNREIRTFNFGTESHLAFEGLASFGVITLEPPQLQLAFDATNEPDRDHRSKSTVDREESVIRDMAGRVPQSISIFQDIPLSNCSEHYSVPDISKSSISKIWRWHTLSGDRWIVFSEWAEDSGAHPEGCLVLLRENSGNAVVRLNPEVNFPDPRGLPPANGGIEIDALAGSSEGQKLHIDVSRLTETMIAVAFENGSLKDGSPNNGIVLIDAEGATRTGPRIPLIDGLLLSQLRLTNDSGLIVQLNIDGRIFVHRVADGKRMLQGAYVDDEPVVMTEDGQYDTSYEGNASVLVKFKGIPGLFAVDQFEAILRRPNVAKDALEDRGVAAQPASLQMPPTAQLILSAIPEADHRIGQVFADSERGLSAIRVYVDGRLSSELPVQGRHVEAPVNLPDPGGARWISAVAVDARGLVSLPSAIQLPGPPRPRSVAHVVAVGVDTYLDPNIPTLQSTKVDARHFVQAITSTKGHAFASVDATTLLDTEVTPESVRSAIRTAVSKTSPDDTIFFFFAGHGVAGTQLNEPNAGLVLATNRTRVSDLDTTSVSWQSLSELLGESKGRVVVVLDACHSGAAGRDAFSTNDDIVSALFTKSGAPLIVLAASKGRQFSEEAANGGGGRFTNAIVAALTLERSKYDRDRSGLIDVDELYAGVKTRVETETHGQQTPWLVRNRLVGEISLF